MSQKNRGRTALITGASGGIGLEFARLFARGGYNIVLVARDEAKLRDLAADLEKRGGVSTYVIPKDLSLASAPQEIYDELQREGISVDVLVNNAGYSVYGAFAETDQKAELDMLAVNVVTLTHLTKLFLPGMISRGSGKILNLGSTAAFLPGPYMAAYYASKAYVLSFSEAIGYEVRGTGVTVTVLCPGPTKSGFQDRANMHDSRLMNSNFMGAREVAVAGYKALMRGQPVIIPGRSNWLVSQAQRFMPRSVLTRVSGRSSEPA